MKATLRRAKEITQIKVLSVGLGHEDCSRLATIFTHSDWPSGPDHDWKLQSSTTLRAAVSAWQKEAPHIIVCEKSPGSDSWRDLLDPMLQLSDPPSLIVASRIADEYLWAEALNLGAYDVLAAPFDPAEVMRVLCSAWLHRIHRKQVHPSRAMRAAAASADSYLAAG